MPFDHITEVILLRQFLTVILAAYLMMSAAVTAGYHLAPYPTPEKGCSLPWEIAKHRSGFLIFDADADGLWVLNPLNNYADDWICIVPTTLK